MDTGISSKPSLWEKIAYALGDASANIAWRGICAFLLIYYTDVYGLAPAAVGLLFLVVRFSDGVSDVAMGIAGDMTRSKYGKFRPWVLWTAIPLAAVLSLTFTCPSGLGYTGKLVYAYVMYILFTLVYTANNIPYGALMAVMTDDDRERASIGSFRMAGAFAGGMVVQGLLLFLVAWFGGIDPSVDVAKDPERADACVLTVTSPRDVAHVDISTKDMLAKIVPVGSTNEPTVRLSVPLKAGEKTSFAVTGEEGLSSESFTIVDQNRGYSYAIYSLSVVLAICLFITFFGTRERVSPPANQHADLWSDFRNLARNRPWVVLLVVGLLFNVYNAIRQGITVIYFTHYVNRALLAGGFFTALMIASIVGALATAPLVRLVGKKRLFVGTLLAAGAVNALFAFCAPTDIALIFAIGVVGEALAAVFPTLFFTMLGDAADYSEHRFGRRATGLVYSAGSFATKFGGGIAGAIIGAVLARYGYVGTEPGTIPGAIPGIRLLMGVIPSAIAAGTSVLMLLYPLSDSRLSEITAELAARRKK
ncbi:MAG: MFS transporter [Kiritimatiellae bacterium]|nr:MFS transporter [Kiritimatiellia bacterium]